MRLAGGLIRTPADRAVAALVAFLFVVPTLVLVLGSKPDRFGFQMYSGYGVPTATWTDTHGTVHEIELSGVVARTRGEIEWTAVLPQHLCDRYPDAISVEVSQVQPRQPRVRSVQC